MSMYKIYIDGLLLPWGTPKLTTKIKNRDEEIDLINGEVMSIPRSPGLTTWKFEAYLPNADEYLEKFEDLKLNKKPFRFIVNRGKGFNPKKIANPDYVEGSDEPNWVYVYDDAFDGINNTTNILVTLEDYQRTESSEYAQMSVVSLTLKEYVHYTTSFVILDIPKEPEEPTTPTQPVDIVTTEIGRLTDRNPPNEYEVKPIPADTVEFEGEVIVINYNRESWKDIASKLFGDEKYWEQLRDTNPECEPTKGTYGEARKYPAKLYPKKYCTIKIDVKTIVELYYKTHDKE